MEDLWRVRRSLVGGGRELGEGEWVRLGIARSMRSTEAPLSARRSPAKGPERLVSDVCGVECGGRTWSKACEF